MDHIYNSLKGNAKSWWCVGLERISFLLSFFLYCDGIALIEQGFYGYALPLFDKYMGAWIPIDRTDFGGILFIGDTEKTSFELLGPSHHISFLNGYF